MCFKEGLRSDSQKLNCQYRSEEKKQSGVVEGGHRRMESQPGPREHLGSRPQNQYHIEAKRTCLLYLISRDQDWQGLGRGSGGLHLAKALPQEKGTAVIGSSQHPSWDDRCAAEKRGLGRAPAAGPVQRAAHMQTLWSPMTAWVLLLALVCVTVTLSYVYFYSSIYF